MLRGVQSLETILREAQAVGEPLSANFDFPVLILVSEDSDLDPVTAVTASGPAATPVQSNSQTTLVVPIRSRYPANRGQPKLSFGRSDVCDVVIPIASISKHHGYFEVLSSVWLVSDAGSTNGTSVGGNVVSKSGTALTDGLPAVGQGRGAVPERKELLRTPAKTAARRVTNSHGRSPQQ